jgi:hypothetical protein
VFFDFFGNVVLLTRTIKGRAVSVHNSQAGAPAP